MSSRRRDGEMRRKEAAAAAEEEEAPALDMLDEYWFFSNTLVKNESRPPMLPRSPSTSSSAAAAGGRAVKAGSGAGKGTSRFYASGCRRLLRTPSLPSPRVGLAMSKDDELAEEEEEEGGAVEDDDDLNWSAIYEGVLLTRIDENGGRSSALHRAPSMPVPSSAAGHDDGYGGELTRATATMSTPSMPRLRHSHSTLDRHCRSHTPTKADHRTPRSSRCGGREVRSFSANQQATARSKQGALLFQDKKWKSSSDLESIEVQGFRDLGFVFDKEELRESLADVLPGLRAGKATPSGSGSGSDNDDASAGASASSSVDGVGSVRRPYLSEAWHHRHVQRSASPAATIRLHQADARSAAQMKDQIRVWAQAVACNVRQEC